ncbi:hypothetical protein BDV36DRAFT_294098 [Aspergillus pseudocaelatus]|uniref:Uncharacterized protein n=1 Tax=Aspergillus pseudocaelatus TaxID=1825620 RepID=A0ABQ6WQY0_9EURO|nr:hypothetical protein BDV36DRAFT_294098 [Aspergillus pseudocaelatus]
MPFFFKTYTINVLLAGVLVVQVASAHPFTDTTTEKRGKNHPKLSTADFPSMGYACPKTDKYADITTYTSGQLTKAYAKAAKYANEGTTFETSSSHPPPATVNLITASRGEGAF